MVKWYVAEALIGAIIYFFTSDIYLTTGFLIVSTLSKCFYIYRKDGYVKNTTAWISAAVVTTCLATILFHDPVFIKWKGMTTSLAIGLFITFSPLFLNKPAMHYFLRHLPFNFSEQDIENINLQTGLLFLALTVMSVCVLWFYTEEEWFAFKTIVFPLILGVYAFFQFYAFIEKIKFRDNQHNKLIEG